MKLRKVLRYINSANKHISPRRFRKQSVNVAWIKADDIKIRLGKLIKLSDLPYNIENITALRSYSSKSRAYARIWGLSKVWQLSLNLKPHYIIEVLSEKYDKLPDVKKDEVLLHELAHIPQNFSGSLLPHIKHGKRNFRNRVDKLIKSVNLNSRYK
jgi:predicted metallopeptidase